MCEKKNIEDENNSKLPVDSHFMTLKSGFHGQF